LFEAEHTGLGEDPMPTSYLDLKIDGQSVIDVIPGNVSVTQELNRHWWCHIQCRHLGDQRLGIGDQSAMRVEQWLGKDLQVVAVESGVTIFDGFVFDVELVYERSGAYSVMLQGVTKSYKMSVTERHAYYSGLKLADLAQQLAQNVGLKARVKCSDRRPLNYVQWGESDFDFLRRIADDHGCWIRPSREGIEIYDEFQSGTTLQWQAIQAADHLTSFSLKGTLSPPSFDGAHYHFHEMQSKTYKGVSDTPNFYDAAGHLVEASKKGSENALPPAYLHNRARAVTLEDYEKVLKKESVRSIGSRVTGSGESDNHSVLPGNQVQLKGTLDADGAYGITHVSHTWDPSGYSNHFSCTPWKNYTDPQAPAMKPMYGVVSARVVDNNDPGKMGRVKVQYFWQEDGNAYWARMLTPHSGADRGFMFMPEIGDEVVVAFEDGDTERPLVLGCLWNGVDQAPRQEFWGGELENNDVKRIVTKSGHRLQFVDKKQQESIVMATPKELKISLIEKTDETGRSMITLHAENGDILLSAPNGRIHVHGKFFSRDVG
jgi:type VI secretion system secreted protein VgrG